MKKILFTIAALVLSATVVCAQDMAKITETYNNGAAALSNGENAAALEAFQQALNDALALGGEQAEGVATNCRNIIPQVAVEVAKDFAKNGDMDTAIAKLNEAISFAQDFGAPDVVDKAKELIGQFLSKKGADLINLKDFAGAAVVYKQILEANAADGSAALRLGQCLAATGDSEGAIAAFKQAAENGQDAAAKKQLATLSLKAASGALKTKNFAAALDKALEAVDYMPTNATAYKIAGNAAAQLKKYKDAAKYFQKYVDLSPKAADVEQMKKNIELFKKL